MSRGMQISRKRPWTLVCPDDRGALGIGDSDLVCSICGKRYVVRDNVVQMLSKSDPFYEGAYNNQVRYLPRPGWPITEWPLWLLAHGYIWAVRNSLRPGSRVLELGCAGGIAWFGKHFDMCGIDLSLEGLRLAAHHYSQCVQADAAALPLPDSSVDAIVSASFWEHINDESKRRILGEMKRVLRPGGLFIFQYDVETLNPIISLYRNSRPDLYISLFIEGDAHVGYQTIEENLLAFKNAGFLVVRNISVERTWLQSPSVWSKFAEWPGRFGRMGIVLSALGNKIFLYPYLGALRIIDVSIGRLFPTEWGRVAITIAQKK